MNDIESRVTTLYIFRSANLSGTVGIFVVEEMSPNAIKEDAVYGKIKAKGRRHSCSSKAIYSVPEG